MRRTVSTDQDAALARLAGDVERLTATIDRLAGLPALVATHARALTDLTDLVGRLRRGTPSGQDATGGPGDPESACGPGSAGGSSGGPGDPAGPADGESGAGEAVAPEWLTVQDPALAIAWMNELTVWVPTVWQRYLQTETPPCWPWHPDVVAELLVCKTLWDEALLDAPAAGALAAWNDRWRPGAARRVEHRMAGCERAFGHHKIRSVEYRFDRSCLDEVAEWWATTHGRDRARPVPGLTVAQGQR